MKTKILFFSFFLFFFSLFGSEPNGLSAPCADLGFNLLKSQKDNSVFSPYSIENCFLMTYLGAAGETEKEIKKALFLNVGKEKALDSALELEYRLCKAEGITLETANALWLNYNFRLLPGFENGIREYFLAQFFRCDFENANKSIEEINRWAAEKTRGKIKHILSPGDLGPAARLILLNSVYFNAEWLQPFKSRESAKKPFFYLPDASLPIDMMNQKSSFLYLEENDLEIAALPFKNRDFIFLVILPKTGMDLAKQEMSFSNEALQRWLDKLAFAKLNLTIPKFAISRRLNLKQLINMPKSFSKEADFSNMSMEPLYIYDALHEAVFSLNESGIEAAAVTAISFNTTSCREGITEYFKEFTANRPFAFLIVDKESRTVLFLGKFTKPQ